MFCASELVFGGAECVGSLVLVVRARTRFWRFRGVGSHFHVLRSRTHFRQFRGRPVPFSCIALSDSFSTVTRASGPVFMFCAPGHTFGGTEGVGSRFHVLRSRTHFRRYRGSRVLFSCFALLDSFSAVPSASGPVFTFCAPGLVFGGSEGAGTSFHVLRAPTHFRRFRGRLVPFSCFALPDSYWAVPWASGPVFMFCAPGLIFAGSVGVWSRFLVLRSRTPFRWCRVRRVPFSCFARPDSFSAIRRASVPSKSGLVFMFCSPGLVFKGAQVVWSRFLALRGRTRFRRYGGRQVPFSCFAR
jgi:hypothetical protein